MPASDQLYTFDGTLWRCPGRPPIDTAFILGVTKPTTSNVAVGLSPTTIVTTATTFAGSGTVVNDTQFDNWVTVTGTNITFNRCLFRGAPSGDPALGKRIVEVRGASVSNAVFNHCK